MTDRDYSLPNFKVTENLVWGSLRLVSTFLLDEIVSPVPHTSNAMLVDHRMSYIFGKPELIEFLELKKKIDKSKIPFEIITSFYFFQSNRLDLKINNDILIKLPSKYSTNTLDNVDKIIDPRKNILIYLQQNFFLKNS